MGSSGVVGSLEPWVDGMGDRSAHVSEKAPKDTVTSRWVEIYTKFGARVYTGEKTEGSSGKARIGKRLRPDMIVLAPSIEKLSPNFSTRRVGREPVRIAILQENKRGDDFKDMVKAIDDLRVYSQQAKERGVTVEGERVALDSLVFAIGSLVSASSPYFHDHESSHGPARTWHFYLDYPEFQDFAVGPHVIAAIRTAQIWFRKIGFAFYSHQVRHPTIFMNPSSLYQVVTPAVTPLDRWM